MDIDWLNRESHVLLNPRMPEEEQARLRRLVPDLPGHVWLATSGSTGSIKLAGLAKDAILASAAAVNRRFSSNASDVWLGLLPRFHVGGLGVLARAFLSGARVVTEWSEDVTLAPLVPAQVYDLVQSEMRPPPALRAVIVGGGMLEAQLYQSGTEVGWPLLPSYGMTETASQVATALPGNPELVLLDHAEAGVDEGGMLRFRGPSLLTGYATEAGLVDPCDGDGWFHTDDIGEVAGAILRVAGRSGDFVKIGGESVHLARLDAIVRDVAEGHAAVAPVADARLGAVIHLYCDSSVDAEAVRQAYDARVHPFERARKVLRVSEIPRSGLGKLLRAELAKRVVKGPSR